MRLILPLTDHKDLLIGHSSWWLASFVGTYLVIECKGLFGHSMLVTRFFVGTYLVIEHKRLLGHRIIVARLARRHLFDG